MNTTRFLLTAASLALALACTAQDETSPTERSPLAGAIEERFRELDTDGDGKLSREELPRPRAMQRADKDRDGFVTPEEARSALRGFMEQRMGNRGALSRRAIARPTTAPLSVAAITTETCRLGADYSAQSKGISMLVMVDGRIIFEDYPNGGSPDSPHELASGTKSFCGGMAVAAQADGLLKLDDKVADTITEWKADPRKSQVTIRQLLQLTSGIETGGERGRVPDYANAIAAAFVSEPGEKFKYGAVPFQVFGELMRRKLVPKNESPVDYMKRRIFDPIGLEVGSWRKGRDGNPHMPSGAALTARNWAKYGELIRLHGNWQGKEILPADLLDECFKGSEANPAYGITWWLNRDMPLLQRLRIPEMVAATDVGQGASGMPPDLVMAAGAGKQRLYVSRKLKLVVVRQATGIIQALMNADQTGFTDQEFLSLLLTGKSASAE